MQRASRYNLEALFCWVIIRNIFSVNLEWITAVRISHTPASTDELHNATRCYHDKHTDNSPKYMLSTEFTCVATFGILDELKGK